MTQVTSLRSHRYASKVREPGARYEIKDRSHLRLFLAMKWIEETQEAPVVPVGPAVLTYQDSPEAYRTSGYSDYLRSDMQAERPKRKYTRKVKVEE